MRTGFSRPARSSAWASGASLTASGPVPATRSTSGDGSDEYTSGETTKSPQNAGIDYTEYVIAHVGKEERICSRTGQIAIFRLFRAHSGILCAPRPKDLVRLGTKDLLTPKYPAHGHFPSRRG